jgi:hypothetical protein
MPNVENFRCVTQKISRRIELNAMPYVNLINQKNMFVFLDIYYS